MKKVKRVGARNIIIKPMTYSELSARVREKLGIHVSFNSSWYYKICDYKPTFAHLFPEIFENGLRKHRTPYKFWAYGDIDVIWGNFRHFSHLFHGQYSAVRAGQLVYSQIFYYNIHILSRL
jgi:hypothetical protein